MAGYVIRPLAELSQQARAFFTQSIPGAIASVWANTFTVVGKVLALLNFEHELRRRWLFAQLFASTADDVWLARHGFELGLTPSGGLKALGTVTLAATPSLAVPAGLQFLRPDGVTYTTLHEATAAGNSVSLAVEADALGAAGNADPGTVLTLLDPDDAPDGLGLVGTVDPAGLAGGADAEPLETFRARVLKRKRQPPQGGSAPDYATWVGEALGETIVERVYVDSFSNDARSVWVAFTVTDSPNRIPTPAQVAIAQAYIDDPVRRPVTARAFAVQLAPLPIPVLIQRLTPDTPDVRASVEAELAAEFIDRVEPSRPTAPTSLSRSWLSEAVSRAVGERRNLILAPATDLRIEPGYLPVLGPVRYTD